MENQQGTIQTISQQNNAVQIDDTWYDLGPNVKISYLKKGGTCEYQVEESDDDSNDVAVFVKMIKKAVKHGTVQNPAGPGKSLEDSNTHRMSALKFAGNVFMGTGQEEDAKRLTGEAMEFLEKGVWISKEKPEWENTYS